MQTPTEVLNIGADVAKDEIVVACSQARFPVRKLANQRSALLAFLKGLPAGSRIGMESTGTYHELLANAAHKLGFVVFVLNPKDARHYARAVGLRGKTDRVDAELLARMIAHEHTKLHAWIPPTGATRDCSTDQTSRQAQFLASGTRHVAQGSGRICRRSQGAQSALRSGYCPDRPASQSTGRGKPRSPTTCHPLAHDRRCRPSRRRCPG